ncbi:transposase (plasmid) [Rhodococcus qingshengii]|nr:transposase [Rhodococcus qingshengii]
MYERHGLTPMMANEALADPNRLFCSPDPASKSGASDRTIGWSDLAGAVLVVITVADDGVVFGVNGWIGNDTAKRLYQEGI